MDTSTTTTTEPVTTGARTFVGLVPDLTPNIEALVNGIVGGD